MGSLNGDVLVMRNGRSTSQVSVYNYPEHLNPFYEDDQHKRLRFWKINKTDKEGRRNSFSISNLKDMWSFKSFRMKKKSSTLGINKTSESPPTLRREYATDNGWNTFDHRLRSSNTSSMNGDNFERNATYRSSLQTLPTSNDRMGLNRNDGYRSTIQVTRSKPRYQPQSQQQTTAGVSQQRRSSQSSMVSTNPFDTDNEDDNEDINSSGMMSVNGDSTNTLSSRTPRKKRRAPAPPTPIHGRPNGVVPPTILIESSQDSDQDELRIREDMDIANLTAEIQSFVKTKDNDDVETPVKEHIETTTTTITTVTTETPKDVEKIKPTTSETTVNSTITTTVATTNMTAASVESPEQIKTTSNSNGPVTTEAEITTTTITTTTKDGNKYLEKNPSITKATNETTVTKPTDESKEIKSNGAIPKKPNSSVASETLNHQQQQQQSHVDDVCLKQTNKDDKCPATPIPAKRLIKPETEVGHVECIHVHVESPRSSPRLEHNTSGVSSFKIEPEVEKITTKTPFVLTSPPTQRRKAPPINEDQANLPKKETVHIVENTNRNERSKELNITEERINTKPEIFVKPTLSPKPITEPNGKIHTFAEIHKPMRNKQTNSQNGHIRKVSRDEIIPPPMVPITKSKPDEMAVDSGEKKIINSSPTDSSSATETQIGNGTEKDSRTEIKTNGNLKIEETSSSTTASLTKEQHQESNSTSVVTVKSNNEARRDMVDDFELLYRPKPSSHMEWKRSTLAPLETHIPPEKRKSVKDIIESINRSQRLLQAAANKDFTVEIASSSTEPIVENNNNNNIDLKFLDENEKEFQRLVDELGPSSPIGNAPTAAATSFSNSNVNNEYLETQKLDNNDVFQKSKFKKEVYDYRESSPISSNLDWNPVPKPKRTKPFQE